MSVQARPLEAGQLSIDSDVPDHAQAIAERLKFATDDQLAAWLRPAEARLRLVENFLADQRAKIPAVERECAGIRQNIQAVRAQLETGT